MAAKLTPQEQVDLDQAFRTEGHGPATLEDTPTNRRRFPDRFADERSVKSFLSVKSFFGVTFEILMILPEGAVYIPETGKPIHGPCIMFWDRSVIAFRSHKHMDDFIAETGMDIEELTRRPEDSLQPGPCENPQAASSETTR